MADDERGPDAPNPSKAAHKPRGPTNIDTDLAGWELDWRYATGRSSAAPNEETSPPPVAEPAASPTTEPAKVSRKARQEGRKQARPTSPFSKKDPRLGLSIAARLRMVEGLSGKGRAFFDQLRKAAVGDGHLVQKDRVKLTLQVYLDVKKRTVDPQLFVSAVFDGARAVTDLHAWLTTGEMRLGHRTELLPQRVFHPNPAREEVLKKAIAFINSDTLTPILRVSGDGMGEGLRAFAGALKDRLADEDIHKRAVLYLPISRAAPKTQNAEHPAEEKVSYARLVGYLMAFFTNAQSDRPAPPLNAHEIRAALDHIRMEMARRPCVLVLDGWAAFSGPLPALGGILVDDGLSALLEELTHPYREPGQANVDPATFLKNRFVILAASSEQIDSPFLGPETLLLPAPSSANMVAIVESQGRTRLKLLAPTLQAKRTELILAMTQYLANLAEPDDLDPETQAVFPDPDLYPTDEDALRVRVTNDIRARKLVNLVFTIIVLMPDGVRRTTLERIIATWREIWPLAPISEAWELEPPAKGEIDEALAILHPLLVVGIDDFVRGLDGRALDMRQAPHAAEPDRQARAYIDFAVPRMRELFAQRLVGADKQNDAMAIARLHRIMGEIAMGHFNAVVLHADWRDATDARFYRRLFQAIYHGLCSLAQGAGVIDPALRGLHERALPADPARAYERIYAVQYRELLESPPAWFLSRSVGRDDIKADLILLMMHVDDRTPWKWLMIKSARDSPTAREPKIANMLLKGMTTGWTASRAVALDQLTSLAKAALRNNELPVATAAVKLGRSTVDDMLREETKEPVAGARPELLKSIAALNIDTEEPSAEFLDQLGLPRWPRWSPALRTKLAIEKIGIDIDMVSHAKDVLANVAPNVEEPLVDTFGFPDAWLRLLERLGEGLTPSTDIAARVERRVALIEKLASAADVETLSAWSDLMGLLGEVNVIDAEQGATADEGRQGRFRLAFMLLASADRLRRLAFEREPLRRDYHINPHTSRVLVRTLIQLTKFHRRTRDHLEARSTNAVTIEEQAAQRAEAGRHGEAGDYFYDQAVRQFAILQRYVGSFATERPSLLILKSGLERSQAPDTVESLTRCEILLAEADRLMTAATHRPRVRLRLLRERVKIYRQLAKTLKDEKRQNDYAALAFLDIDRLYRLAEHAELNLWMSIAVRQWGKMVKALSDAKLEPPVLPGLHQRLSDIGFKHVPEA